MTERQSHLPAYNLEAPVSEGGILPVLKRLPADYPALQRFIGLYSRGHTHVIVSREELFHLQDGGLLAWDDSEYTHSIELEPVEPGAPVTETCRFCGLEWLCPECRREGRPEALPQADRDILRALVDALPPCDHCGRPATQERYAGDPSDFTLWCGDCGGDKPWGHCDLDYAVALRAAIQQLGGS